MDNILDIANTWPIDTNAASNNKIADGVKELSKESNNTIGNFFSLAS